MPTWMVVEDEPDIYDVLLAMFEIWGIEGVAFVDGGDAFSWIDDVDAGRVRGELPELAILDIRLPEVSGPEVSARLRKSPILGEIAIVLITAYHMPPEQEEEVMKLSQADLLLYKPLPAMPELRDAMDKVIAKHKGSDTGDEAVASSESKSARSNANAKGESSHPTPQGKPAVSDQHSKKRESPSTNAKRPRE